MFAKFFERCLRNFLEDVCEFFFADAAKFFLLTWLGGGLGGLGNRAKKCPHLPQTILLDITVIFAV